MKTISDVELAQVIGGKGPDATAVIPSSGGSGGGNNDAVLSALNGIQSSLSDLGKNNNNGGLFGGSNGLMFGVMAGLAMRNRSSNVVVHGSWGSRRGFSWSAHW
jgi:bacteriocin-like protein